MERDAQKDNTNMEQKRREGEWKQKTKYEVVKWNAMYKRIILT